MRPPKHIDWEKFEELKKKGKMMKEIAEELDMSYTCLRNKIRRRKRGERIVKRLGRPPKYLLKKTREEMKRQ